MKKSFDDIEDLLIDESFRSWVIAPTPDLDRQWNSWLEENKDKEELIQQSRELVLALKFKEHKASEGVKGRILDQVLQDTDIESKQSKHVFVHFKYWTRIAAILLLTIGISALAYFFSGNLQDQPTVASEVEFVEKSNPYGSKSRHTLSDGSLVYLNAGSSIRYPKVFPKDNRMVELQGEAFFDVSHDQDRPFQVIAEDFKVRVLGTKFNVNTSEGKKEVALVEGKVRMQSSDNAEVDLKPSELAKLNSSNNVIELSSFDVEYMTGWKDGQLIFREATLDEVAQKLHAWYGKKVIIENRANSPDWSYTGSFKNESLKTVLSNMQALRDFDYQMKNDSLILSF